MSDTPLVDQWKKANHCDNWPEVGISVFSMARDLERLAAATERDLDSALEERDELKEEVKSLKETILDQEHHIMELERLRRYSPGPHMGQD